MNSDIKEIVKIMFIYQALEKGWIVKRGKNQNSFEFIKDDHFIQRKKVIKRSISEPLKLSSYWL